jgi:hypothetical protein
VAGGVRGRKVGSCARLLGCYDAPCSILSLGALEKLGAMLPDPRTISKDKFVVQGAVGSPNRHCKHDVQGSCLHDCQV